MDNNNEDRLTRYRAKRIRFFINGDKYFRGINYALNTEKIRSFEYLLNDLNRLLNEHSIALIKGVRCIFSIDGNCVKDLTDFQEGQAYVCSSTDTFINTNYLTNNGMLNWLVRNSACISSSRNLKSPGNNNNQDLKTSSKQTIDSKNHISKNLEAVTPTSHRSKSPNVRARQTISLSSAGKVSLRHLNGSNNNSYGDIKSAVDGDVRSGSRNRDISTRRVRNLAGTTNADTSTSSPQEAQNKTTTPKQASHNSASHKSSASASRLSAQSTPNQVIRRNPKESIVSSKLNQSARLPSPAPKARPSKVLNGHKTQNQIATPIDDKFIKTSFPAEVSNRYDIGRPIGDGHFSVVYCCMNRESQQFCALKLIDKLKCRGKDDMIYNEVKILKRLEHPNIVKLIEEFDTPKQLYLILELVQDGDLFDAITTVTKFNEVDVATMIHNLSSALSYLHRHGIVHRDIKPENLLILVQEDGSQSIKLADFGLAIEVEDSPLYNVCGTAFYVSPEMLNETGYKFKVDVWSTGVICYILLCGYPPFTSENESNQDELFDAILAGEFQFAPPSWNHISSHAKSLIKSMLTVDPEERYTAEQVFNHPWTRGESSNFDGINPMNLSRLTALQRSL